MSIIRLLRRNIRLLVFRIRDSQKIAAANIRYETEEEPIRIMSDKEFAEYLRLHSRSQWWKV